MRSLRPKYSSRLFSIFSSLHKDRDVQAVAPSSLPKDRDVQAVAPSSLHKDRDGQAATPSNLHKDRDGHYRRRRGGGIVAWTITGKV